MTDHSPTHPVRRSLVSWRSRIGVAAAIVLAFAAVATAGSFWLTGGRWFVVRTPSMGTYAPVGTLVLTRPTTVDHLHVGDVIAFHPPTEPSETYTHRIVSIHDGQIHTRGDINAVDDPWTVRQHDLIGHAAVVLPGVGWLVRALPYLAIGSLLVLGLTRMWVGKERRGPARTFGLSMVFLGTSLLLKPFVGVIQLQSASEPNGVASISVVSTGLLPVKLTAQPGTGQATPITLHTGETGVARLHGGIPGHKYVLDTHLALTWWQWAAAILISLVPLLYTVAVGYRPVVRPRHVAALA
jgi:signal peptidase I